MRMSHARLLLALLLIALSACGQAGMMQTTAKVRDLMTQQRYDAALELLHAQRTDSFGAQDRVVYWMEEGMLRFLAGEYEAAIASLSKAEDRARELFTVSISKELSAVVTSQAKTDYAGEDHEKVLINVIKALCFLALNDLEGALVEARKINEQLAYFNAQYGEHKNVYRQDAFAHWLMGILFELERSYDDARIAFVHADRVYREDFAVHYGTPAPSWLAEDIVRAALLSGDDETAAQYRKRHGEALGTTRERLQTQGEVILIHLNGQGPTKIDYTIGCWFTDKIIFFCDARPGDSYLKKIPVIVPPGGTAIKVAFPQMQTQPPANARVLIRADTSSARTQRALPINAIAEKTLRDRLPRIFRDTILRAITKTLAAKAAGMAGRAAGGDDAGRTLGWLFETVVSLTMQASEEADKRTWSTLPASIDIARLWLDPGMHTLTLHYRDRPAVTIPQIRVAAGQRVFVTHRSLP